MIIKSRLGFSVEIGNYLNIRKHNLIYQIPRAMRINLILLFLCMTFLGKAETANSKLVKDMVQFDQAFIPVLYHVKNGKMAEAKKATLQMRFYWMKLKNRHQFLVNDPAWEDAFCRADDWIDDALQLMHENEPHLTYIQLNQARYEMTELRRQFKIDYYLDYVFNFQEMVETLSEVLHDEKLYLLEWNQLESMIGRMNATWLMMRRQQLNPADFKFNAKERQRLTSLQLNIAKELLFFNDLTAEAHQLKMRIAIEALEREANNLLLLFGDFEGQPTYFATL